MSGQLSLADLCGIQLAPDALDEQRGAWCSPLDITAAAGRFDLDPFTNPRSTLCADRQCMLERLDDGFGHVRIPRPPKGSYAVSGEPGRYFTTEHGYEQAGPDTSVWIQPDYEFVLQALAHYGHTRFVALLRLDPSTVWFQQLHEIAEVIMVPKRDRVEFVPPPGVKPSSNPFPHGLFYRRAADVTPAIESLCYAWRINTAPRGRMEK